MHRFVAGRQPFPFSSADEHACLESVWWSRSVFPHHTPTLNTPRRSVDDVVVDVVVVDDSGECDADDACGDDDDVVVDDSGEKCGGENANV